MRKPDLMLAVVAAIGLSSALWCWRQLQEERERVTSLQRQVTELQTQLDRAAAEVPATSTATPAAPVTAATQTDVAKPKPVVELSEEEARELAQRREMQAHMRAAAERERVLLRDPAYRQAQHDEMRRRYAPRRAEAIRVGMTPEQADRVVDLEIERFTRYRELGGISGQPPNEEMQAELKRAADAEQAELRKLLGEDLYATWKRYQASGQERAEVRNWQSQLSTTEPLSARDLDALVDSLYVERERRSREYEEYVKSAGIVDRNIVSPQDRQRWLDLEREANQRTHDAMASRLSAAQLASLDQMLAARLVPIETALRMQLEGKLANTK